MEPLTVYVIAHSCLVVACWLLNHADNHSISLPTGYLGCNIFKRPIKPQTTQLWF